MFRNEPLTDFTVGTNRTKLKEGLALVDERIRSGHYRAASIIVGTTVASGEEAVRIDPSDGTTVVGRTLFATEQHVDEALRALRHGVAHWADTNVENRTRVVMNAANLMRTRREELSALIIREGGKPWREADADVAEAIDFCDYYAEEAEKLGQPFRTYEVPGEDNSYFYQPRGICAVISPWNFPLAIACGMTVAALVTGNATILKPSEQTSIIAYEFAKILLEAGVPTNVFAFLPGRGEVVGRRLTASPYVDMICFTGSKAVGLEIISTAAKVVPGQKSIKRVVAELGGKNAVIVDEDADLDEAVKGVLYSAFGFSGQKCSACSRLIGVGDAYEPLMRRLCSAASDLIIGPASDPGTLIGPVIDPESQERINRTIAVAEDTTHLAFRGQAPSKGNFVAPAIFREVESSDPIWREEIFGPVLACAQAENFEEALAFANDSEYALTGGLYSRSPAHIQEAVRKFKVGNLYINRGCTGALVCRQPFGGFRMSGVGSKAGGKDYLLQFVEPRVVSENTMRRGFVPS